MKWPLVSRLGYDMAIAERDRLLEEAKALHERISNLVDHTTRMDRIDRGIGETPREPREEIGHMPKALLEHCNSWANPKVRKELRDQAYRRRVKGESWPEIMLDVMGDEKEEE